MKKDEFLKKLEEDLDKLEEADLKKVIRKYKATFTRKAKSGKSEEEIVREFGNYHELVNGILKEHGIETPGQASANTITDFFNEFLNVVEDIVNFIAKRSVTEVVILILKLILMLILISLLKLPILFIRDLGTGILDLLFMPLSTVLIFCWRFMIEILYVIIAITVFVKAFNIIIKPTFKKKKSKNSKK